MVSYYFSVWELKADECSEEKLLGKVIGSRNVYNVSMTVPKNSWYHILDKNTCCIVFLDYVMLKLVFIFIICMSMYLYYRQVRKIVWVVVFYSPEKQKCMQCKHGIIESWGMGFIHWLQRMSSATLW